MKNTKVEAALWSLAFLDLLGFGMLIPDAQIRLESMGSKGWAIGAILSSMFLVQVLVSSAWGRLSDRVGRKPVVVICTLLSATAMFIYAKAENPAWILASRIIAGLGAANIAVAQAYIADLNATKLVSAMGRIGAAVSTGLIAGPALGGLLSSKGGNHLLGLVAGGCSLIGALTAWVMLPSVRPTKQSTKPRGTLSLLREIKYLPRVFGVIAVGWLSLATLEGTFGRLLKNNLGMGAMEFGWVFSYESVLGLIVQAFVLKWIESKVHPTLAMRLAYLCMGLGLVVFPFSPNLGVIFLGSTIYAFGSAVANPTANALCSSLVSKERQGELFGLLQSARSFGFLVGPGIGGWLFDRHVSAPYVGAALICLAAMIAVPGQTLFEKINESAEPEPA